jgi:hypothetical protein
VRDGDSSKASVQHTHVGNEPSHLVAGVLESTIAKALALDDPDSSGSLAERRNLLGERLARSAQLAAARCGEAGKTDPEQRERGRLGDGGCGRTRDVAVNSTLPPAPSVRTSSQPSR